MAIDLPTYLTGTIFTKAYRVIRTHVGVCLDQYGLTPTAWSLLGLILQERDGISLADSAAQLGVKASLISVLSQNLVDRQLVERIPHQTDKRTKLLVLTSQGERFVSSVERQLQRELSYLLRGVLPNDLAAYKRVLETIIQNGTV